MHLNFDMGKYAVFVWSAYGATFVALAGVVFDTVQRLRTAKAAAAALEPPLTK